MNLEKQKISGLERQAQAHFEKTTPELRQLARDYKISVAALTIIEILGVRKAYDPKAGLTIKRIDEAQGETFSRKNLNSSTRSLIEEKYVAKGTKVTSPRKPGRDPHSYYLTNRGKELYEEVLYCFVTSEKQAKNPNQ